MINSSQHREEETSYLSACFAFSDKESENVAYVDILVFVNTILWLVYYGPAKCIIYTRFKCFRSFLCTEIEVILITVT